MQKQLTMWYGPFGLMGSRPVLGVVCLMVLWPAVFVLGLCTFGLGWILGSIVLWGLQVQWATEDGN